MERKRNKAIITMDELKELSNIKSLKRKYGVTTKEVARCVPCHPQHLHSVEHGVYHLTDKMREHYYSIFFEKHLRQDLHKPYPVVTPKAIKKWRKFNDL